MVSIPLSKRSLRSGCFFSTNRSRARRDDQIPSLPETMSLVVKPLLVLNETPDKDKESDWLPAPECDFWVVLRTYLPGEEIINQTWEMPGLEKMT